jgi:hypothetical protein
VDPDFFSRHSPIDLRARPITDAPVVAVLDATPDRVPVEELASMCGIAIEPVAEAVPESVTRLAGLPLGGSVAHGGRSASWLHRAVAARPLTKTDEAAARSLAGSAVDLSRAWDAARPDAVGWEHGATTHQQTWRSLPVPSRATGPMGDVRAAVDAAVDPSAVWIVELEAGAELRPGRAGNNADLVLAIAVTPASAPGSLLLQVDGRIEALDAGVAHAFDPTERHTVRNLGGSTAYVLCAAVPRSLPRGLAAARRVLARAGAVTPTTAICSR